MTLPAGKRFSTPAGLVVLLLCSFGFALGLWHLFKLRFDLGDVYPEYSSLRADPLGTMAFCESLERTPGLVVRRDFSANNQLPTGRNTTYLHLGARTSDWRFLDQDVFKEIQGFVSGGGRLAITFFPEASRPFELFPDQGEGAPGKLDKSEARKKETAANKKKSERRTSDQTRSRHRISLKTQWGVEMAYLDLKPGRTTGREAVEVENQSSLPLPDTLSWHSAAIFTNLPNSWQIIYARGTNPVVIERKFGSGAIVIATDSYFLSNEALLKDRHPDLLSWWVGPSKYVLFDEAHFGIVETQGVAGLLRKYRLHGLVVGLILLAVLFVWRNGVRFVPIGEEKQSHEYVAGKEAAAGFVNLLRRNIRKRDILNVCFEEWKKSSSQTVKNPRSKQAQAEALLQAESTRPQHERAAVNTYRELCQLLKTYEH